MRRKGLVAIQGLSPEKRRVFFREFGPWRWRHYGVLALLILLPGLILYKPGMAPPILWGLGLTSFLVIALHFGYGYRFLREKLQAIIDDESFLQAYFADRIPMGLLYAIFTFVALQRAGLFAQILSP